MKKKNLFLFITILMMAMYSCSSDDDDKDYNSNIVGTWGFTKRYVEVETTSEEVKKKIEEYSFENTNPTSIVYIFLVDGTGTYKSGNQSNKITYTVKGDKLIITNLDQEEVNIYQFSLTDNSLLFKFEDSEDDKEYWESKYPGTKITKYIPVVESKKIK